MSDDEDRAVLNVLVAPLLLNERRQVTTYLAKTVLPTTVNHFTVFQAVMVTVKEYDIDYNNVCCINTDNAACWLKAFTALQVLLPNAVHITCFAHVLHLVGQAFKQPFDLVNKFILYCCRIFFSAGFPQVTIFKIYGYAKKTVDWNSPCSSTSESSIVVNDANIPSQEQVAQAAKKRGEPGVATENKIEMSCHKELTTMPPDPIGTRWNTWFYDMKYHNSHFSYYKQFIAAELQLSKTPLKSINAT